MWLERGVKINFEVGGLVVLKSGGPVMTISGIGTYGYDVHVSADEPKEMIFRLEMLRCAESTE